MQNFEILKTPFFLLLLFPSTLFSSAKIITATRTEERIKIDGKLDEPSWQLAEPSSGFIQKYPVEDTVPSESTIVRVLYDNKNLYVGVRAFDSEPEKILGRLSRRDTWSESDNITVYIDSYCDKRTAYTFQTNPVGVKLDWYIYNDWWSDWDWNAVWDVGTNIDSLGWTAEFSIPFSILRFQNTDSLTFGFEVNRYISKKRETDEWLLIPKAASGFVSLFGTLRGITDIPTPRQIEFLPYGMGKLTMEEGEKDYFFNAGCDIKYGIGSNFIVDATVNPDFGQVEADPSELNLSVFETYYSEKRPFFMERKDLFKTDFQLFYSRRIGKCPGYFSVLPGDVVKERPDFTKILGAVKLTGKMNGSNFGFLEAVTSPEYAVVDSCGAERKRLIEPLTNYSVFRLKQDVFESSNVGFTATACNRKEGELAYSGGFDWNLKILNDYTQEGQIAFSKTDKKGYADYFRFGKTGGKLLNCGISYSEVSKSFDIKDMGYIYRNNKRNANGWFSIFTSAPWWITYRMGSNFSLSGTWNFERVSLYRGFSSGFWITFRNYWWINMFLGHHFPSYNDWITRGGPALYVTPSNNFSFGASTDSRKSVSTGIYANIGYNESNSYWHSYFPFISLKLLSNLKLSVSPEYSHSFSYAEWVTNIDDDFDGLIDHYVFGELTMDILSASIRSDIAFTKDLTLQLWMQPYIAAGKYSNFKELIDPDKYEFTDFDYEPEIFPDFNQKFLKANIVLRWEYSPGSIAYLVITNALSDFSNPGNFSPIRDLKTVCKAKGERIYLIKISKWWSI